MIVRKPEHEVCPFQANKVQVGLLGHLGPVDFSIYVNKIKNKINKYINHGIIISESARGEDVRLALTCSRL